MAELTPITRHDLWLALLNKCRVVTPDNGPDGENYLSIAREIHTHDLHHVLTGLRHLGKPVTFAKAYEEVYGKKLKCGA